MAGDGFYNAHSPQQAEVAAMSEDALRRAVEMLPASVNATVIADYGCSQGGNSIRPMRVVLDAMRQRTPIPAPLSVVHCDLPRNDWSTLFETVFGPNSYLDDHELVFPSAIGRSFYEPLFPEATVAVGWSGTSVLWLSGRPDVGGGNLFSRLAAGEDKTRWALAAANDWSTFLAPDPAYAAFAVHGDIERFADDEVAQIRGWSQPSLTEALDSARDARGVSAAIDGVFASIRAAVAADPTTGHCDWTMSLLTVSRV